MVLFNYATKELTAKIVYYGPGLCGKTTNLQWIHTKLPIKNKGKMLSLATETDRTLFFDFLPIELGNIRGMRTRMQLYTVPGQVFYNATRRMVLKGADCVVFVADSQEPMLDPNLESLENLRQNLIANEIPPETIPLLFQFNKRDLPNALPVEILNDRLNARNLPYFEAVAIRGDGVEQTLKAATSLVFRYLSTKYSGAAAQGGDVVGVSAAATGPKTAPNLRSQATPAPSPAPLTIPPPPRKVATADLPKPVIEEEIPAELLEPPVHAEPPAHLRTLAPEPPPGTLAMSIESLSVDHLDPGQTLDSSGDDIEALQHALRDKNVASVEARRGAGATTSEVVVPIAEEPREIVVPVDLTVPDRTKTIRLRVVVNVSIKTEDPL